MFEKSFEGEMKETLGKFWDFEGDKPGVWALWFTLGRGGS